VTWARSEPWLTPQAGDTVLELLLGLEQTEATRAFGSDRLRLLHKTTGRERLDATEAAHIQRLGLQWLRLG
jgi:hypothetical protein